MIELYRCNNKLIAIEDGEKIYLFKNIGTHDGSFPDADKPEEVQEVIQRASKHTKRAAKVRTCSICYKEGHQKRTCPSKETKSTETEEEQQVELEGPQQDPPSNVTGKLQEVRNLLKAGGQIEEIASKTGFQLNTIGHIRRKMIGEGELPASPLGQ